MSVLFFLAKCWAMNYNQHIHNGKGECIMKKWTALVVVLMLLCVCGIITGCTCVHEWSEGDCEKPKTCTLCGQQEGEPMGHTWQEATCTAPQTCSTCGAVYGEALGHNYKSITYEPTELDEGFTVYTCSFCGDSYEGDRVEALGYPITEGTLVFRADGVAYLYDGNQEVVETYTGWMTDVYKIEDDYDINAGGVMTTTPWYFSWPQVTNVVIENGVAPASTAYWFTWLPVENILIGDGVTSLDEAMFMYCNSLSTVKFSRDTHLEKIGDYAFEDCWGLREITLPHSVTQIGDGAFYGTDKLDIELPGSLTQIGVNAINNCVVTIADDHPKFHMQDNCMIDTETKTLVAAFEGCIIPDDGSVTKIGDGAFFGCYGVRSIMIPEGITHIGDRAFMSCADLRYVTFPETLVSIGKEAFAFCDLEILVIPDGVTTIGEGAFSDCHYLWSIVLPKDLTMLPASMFKECNALQNVVLPQGLTEIGADTFSQCSSLSMVELPDSLISIGTGAFANSGLSSITLPQGVTVIGDHAFYGCTSLREVMLPESLTTIGDLAFYGCTGLSSVTIPAGVTAIGDNPFAYCSNLSDLTVSPDNTTFLMRNGMLLDLNNSVLILFCGSIMYPEHFDVIGAYACAGYEGMTIAIPEGVTTIGKRAFADCGNLVSLYIPGSVSEIGSGAFVNCAGLSDVKIPQGPTTLNGWFAGCTGLRILELPASITSIGDRSFEDCVLLPNIKYRGSKEQWMQIDKTWYWCGWEMTMEIVCTDGVVREDWYFPY